MGQIEDLRTYVEVVNNGGIARTAEGMNIAKSAISRRIKLLEERYGVQLIDRQPGVWQVTAAGQELYQRALRVLSEADDIDVDFSHARQSLSGPLAVSIPREFGLGFLQPALLRFARRHPEIRLMVDFDDRHVDLERENYDLAIRISGEEDPNLIFERLGRARHRLYASAAYAEKNPLPASIDGLMNHPLLHFGASRRAIWDFETAVGTKSIEFQPALNSNSGHFLLAAVKAGHGIARLPDFIAEDACRDKGVLVVLPQVRFTDSNIMLAYSKKRLLNRRMRLFLDQMSSACRAL